MWIQHRLELCLSVVEEGVMLKPGDLVYANPKLDQGTIIMWSTPRHKGYQPERTIVKKIERGEMGMVVHTGTREGELYVMFSGPSLGWVYPTGLELAENAC